MYNSVQYLLVKYYLFADIFGAIVTKQYGSNKSMSHLRQDESSPRLRIQMTSEI